MSAKIKVVFIVVIGVGACLLSIFFSQHFYKQEHNNHLVLSHIDKVTVRIEHIQVLGRNFIQDAEQTIWGQISQTMESMRRNLQAALDIGGHWRQEIEVLNRSLEDYHGILTQLYEPAASLQTQKKVLQEIGLAFSLEVEEEIIKPYRKEEGLRIYNGKSIDPFKAKAKDAAYDLFALHLKQQLILLELLLSSDLDAYKQKKQHLSTALAQHKAQLRYMAVLMGSEPSIQSVLESLDQKLEKLLNHEHAIIELFTALAELDDRLSATGDKLLAANGQLSSRITSDTLRTGRMNRILNWGLLLSILGGLSVLGALLARNIIQFVEDLKTAQQTIKESEERYRSFIENAPVAMFTINTEGEFTYANRKLLEMTGYKIEDWLNKPFYPIVHPEDLDVVIKRIQKRLEGKGATDPYEIRIFDSSGEIIWVTIISESIYDTDEMGMKKLIGMQSFVEDITERKRAEGDLLESEEKYRMLIENANDAIFIIQDGIPKFPNSKTEDLTGYSREELSTIPFKNLIHPEDREMVLERRRKRLMGQKPPSTYSFRIMNKSGEKLWVQLNTALTNWEGKPATINFIRDITDHKRLEAQLQQAQRMESLGTLAGGIAHDFNNLLMGIQGRTSLMLMDTDSSHSRFEHLKGIEDNVQSATGLTKQLLGFARGGRYEVKPTDLNELIKNQNRMFNRTKKEVSIHAKYEKDPYTADVDRGQIEQVILNLYVNAWQAMPGGGDLYVKTENAMLDDYYAELFEVEPGKYVKISVTDTGIGMDEATQQRIFDPFFTTKEMSRGTGLGLASAYGIIKNHGGFINVYSEKGEGTTFNVYLPISEKEVVEKTESEKEILKGSETVLLVDDEDMVVDVGKSMLEKLGYDVLIAMSGNEALEMYAKNRAKIDIVILDMIMPVLGGGDTYDRLKKIDSKIKVLLSSGYSVNGQASEILERGCNGFIQKPFNMNGLSQKIREILDKE